MGGSYRAGITIVGREGWLECETSGVMREWLISKLYSNLGNVDIRNIHKYTAQSIPDIQLVQ